MSVGLGVAAVGFFVLTQISADSSTFIPVAAFVVTGLGLAPVFTLATDMIVGTAPPERAGAASAISETGAELGGAMGIAILGSIGAAIYRDRMAENLPSGVEPMAAEAARDTLGGAVAVAAELPAEIGSALLFVSRNAFIEGQQYTALVGGIIMVVLAILTAFILRDVRGASEVEEEAEPEPIPIGAAVEPELETTT
jgi:DHA2 family multidrug resistance protein-like MFS transporter